MTTTTVGMVNQTVETAPENPTENGLAHDPRIVIGRETSSFRDLRPGPAILVHRTDLSLPHCTASQVTRQNHASTVAKNHLTTALRLLSQRGNEQGALQLRKDTLEARAKTREKEHAQSSPRYAEFPSLRDCHQKLEKRDAEDLAALRKEINVADSHWLSSAEGFVTTLLQVVAELLHQDKDRRPAPSVSKPSTTDGLEARLNSRLDALGKQHKEEMAKQRKQIEDLQKGLSTETAQRKILGIENDSLKKKLQELQSQRQSLARKVDEHGTSIKQLQEKKSKETPLPPAPQEATVTAEDLKEVKTIADRCRSGLADLEATVTGHDQKLGEIDVDLITDGCVTIAATLPRLEQHAKRAADDISGLRSDHDRLRLDNEKLRSNVNILQSSVQQLQSGTQQLRSEALGVRSSVEQLKSVTDQLKHDTESLKTDTLDLRTDAKGLKSETEHLKAAAEQLKCETTQLRSSSGETQLPLGALQSTTPRPPAGDSFLSVKTFTTMNTAVFQKFSSWVDDLKRRVDVIECQMPTLQTVSKQQSDHSFQIKAIQHQVQTLEKGSDQKTAPSSETRRVTTPAPDHNNIQLEEKWKEHDLRLKTLEANSRKSPYRSDGASFGSTDAIDSLAQRRAPIESMKAAVEALKDQVAIADQSIKALSESAKLASAGLASHTERLGQLENELFLTSRRLMTAEDALRATEKSFEKRLDFMQQNFTTLDSQMNNLSLETLFQAIIQYMGAFQPGEAVVGPKVERVVQQVTAQEYRLAALERAVASSEEPANKKRKLSPSPCQAGMTNGRH
ncbi:hypothetical protein CTA2_3048 [Colletotrichum tanaceti]|uniref:Uncharacterized protein n=1 Tax=Colletotrichum tanaceti TaxID=1306861 RepID=A0A4U6X588_9PEZI|nr:hypothetical protein CTA2_3048 [Colletotrichum tanaceti]TKW50375.1 hypothetical protein CTA1_11218 [Colletotrichum tanaceti]